MTNRKLIAGLTGLVVASATVAVGISGAGAASSKTTINAVSSGTIFKKNRYVQDGLRWNKDAYSVASGGTLHVVNVAADEGPHTFTVVAEKDLPKNFMCKACDRLGKAHGGDPETEGPPKFLFLDNGVGQDKAPSIDRPGDSAFTGPKKGNAVNLKVTAKKGSELYFMCLIHPWMQAKVKVV